MRSWKTFAVCVLFALLFWMWLVADPPSHRLASPLIMPIKGGGGLIYYNGEGVISCQGSGCTQEVVNEFAKKLTDRYGEEK